VTVHSTFSLNILGWPGNRMTDRVSIAKADGKKQTFQGAQKKKTCVGIIQTRISLETSWSYTPLRKNTVGRKHMGFHIFFQLDTF